MARKTSKKSGKVAKKAGAKQVAAMAAKPRKAIAKSSASNPTSPNPLRVKAFEVAADLNHRVVSFFFSDMENRNVEIWLSGADFFRVLDDLYRMLQANRKWPNGGINPAQIDDTTTPNRPHQPRSSKAPHRRSPVQPRALALIGLAHHPNRIACHSTYSQ